MKIDPRPPLLIEVRGMQPAPQGSKVAIPRRGKRGGFFLKESCDSLPAWRRLVADATADEVRAYGMIYGPVIATFEFAMLRPKYHFRTNGELKSNAPMFHSTMPDLSKLVRSTEEELSKRLIEDDARIAIISAFKRYCDVGEQPGVIMTIQAAGSRHAPDRLLDEPANS